MIVELDGSQHFKSEADVLRDADICEKGFTTLRFCKNEVRANTEGVLERIQQLLGC